MLSLLFPLDTSVQTEKKQGPPEKYSFTDSSYLRHKRHSIGHNSREQKGTTPFFVQHGIPKS